MCRHDPGTACDRSLFNERWLLLQDTPSLTMLPLLRHVTVTATVTGSAVTSP